MPDRNKLSGNITTTATEGKELHDMGMDTYKIKKATLLIRALNHPMRKEIIKTIQENPKVIVTDLYTKLNLQQSILSQHLAVLRRLGILSDKREGKFIYYSINSKRLLKINELVKKLVE